MLALCFSSLLAESDEKTGKFGVGNILGGCLLERVLTILCSSILEDARAILSV